jgi:hypothetical protein
LTVSGTSALTGVTTHGDDVVSDADSTDDLGTTSVRWANLFVDGITATDQITATGFTGTLDGILGSGAAAAATVTQLTSGGNIVSDTDSTDSLGTTGVRWAGTWTDAINGVTAPTAQYTSAEETKLSGIEASADVTDATNVLAGLVGQEAVATGFTGTLDGVLGGGSAAAATVTTIDASGVATATTFEPDGDTSAADNAAIGYTAAEGLILTGQGSSGDVTIKNDADGKVMEVLTGTTTAAFAGDLTIAGDLTTGGNMKMTKGGDITSASPLVIDTDGNYFDVTGTTNFAAMTVAAGNFFMLQFDGALTITHGSGIELPGAANLTTAAGDRLICYATAADTVEVMNVATEAAAGGGGAWSLIGSATASTSATLTVTGLTGAPMMIVGADLHPVTENVFGYLRLGDSSGIDSGSTDYRWYSFGGSISSTGASNPDGFKTWEAAQIDMLNSGGDGEAGNAAGQGISFDAFLYNGRGSEQYPSIRGQGVSSDADTIVRVGSFGGIRTSMITTDRIQFLFSSGNIVSGAIYVYELTTS